MPYFSKGSSGGGLGAVPPIGCACRVAGLCDTDSSAVQRALCEARTAPSLDLRKSNLGHPAGTPAAIRYDVGVIQPGAPSIK